MVENRGKPWNLFPSKKNFYKFLYETEVLIRLDELSFCSLQMSRCQRSLESKTDLGPGWKLQVLLKLLGAISVGQFSPIRPHALAEEVDFTFHSGFLFSCSFGVFRWDTSGIKTFIWVKTILMLYWSTKQEPYITFFVPTLRFFTPAIAICQISSTWLFFLGAHSLDN